MRLLFTFFMVLVIVHGYYNKLSDRSINHRILLRADNINTIRKEHTIEEIKSLTSKEAIRAVLGGTLEIENEYLFDNVDILKSSPTITQYVIANPKVFIENSQLAKTYGVDVSELDLKQPASTLATILPVIYIADFDTEYGHLGYLLNKPGGLMNELRPELRMFRNRPYYIGGIGKKGSSLTMVHRKVGFSDNRAFKTIPGRTDFRFFFSPNLAMANELCLTKDASMKEFKFFQWATVWTPRQLEFEYDQKLWVTIAGPVNIFTDDDLGPQCPLWSRVVASLPAGRID